MKKKGIPLVHLITWIFNALIKNEVVYIEFVEKAINPQFPDHVNNPEFSELVKTNKVLAHSSTC